MKLCMQMKWLPLAFAFVLLTGSCSAQQASSLNIYQMNPSNYEILLLSKKNNVESEKEYIDAILELKLKYPEQLSELSLTQKGSDAQEFPSFSQYPALIIQQNGKTIASIKGKRSKQDILKILQENISY